MPSCGWLRTCHSGANVAEPWTPEPLVARRRRNSSRCNHARSSTTGKCHRVLRVALPIPSVRPDDAAVDPEVEDVVIDLSDCAVGLAKDGLILDAEVLETLEPKPVKKSARPRRNSRAKAAAASSSAGVVRKAADCSADTPVGGVPRPGVRRKSSGGAVCKARPKRSSEASGGTGDLSVSTVQPVKPKRCSTESGGTGEMCADVVKPVQMKKRPSRRSSSAGSAARKRSDNLTSLSDLSPEEQVEHAVARAAETVPEDLVSMRAMVTDFVRASVAGVACKFVQYESGYVENATYSLDYRIDTFTITLEPDQASFTCRLPQILEAHLYLDLAPKLVCWPQLAAQMRPLQQLGSDDQKCAILMERTSPDAAAQWLCILESTPERAERFIACLEFLKGATSA